MSEAAPRGALRDIAAMFSGNLAVTVLTVVSSLLVMRWTDPYDMGLWNVGLLVVTYASVLQLGVFNGLNREVPFHLGAGESERAVASARVAHAWCRWLALATVLALLPVSAWFSARGEWKLLATALAAGGVIAFTWYQQYFTVLYGANAQFTRLAGKLLVVAIGGVALVVLVVWLGYAGLLARAALIALAGALILSWRRPMRVAPQFDRAVFAALVRVGVPIWLLGQANVLFATLDRLALADAPRELGHYTIAVQFSTMAAMLPATVSAYLYPRMAREYGATRDASAIWRLARVGALGTMAAGALAGIVAWWLIPPFVRLVLPAYEPGIEAARWASFTGITMGLAVFGNVFNVLGRQLVFLLAAGAGVLAFFVAWQLLAHEWRGPALASAAQAMLFATAVTSIAGAWLSWRTCRAHDHARGIAA